MNQNTTPQPSQANRGQRSFGFIAAASLVLYYATSDLLPRYASRAPEFLAEASFFFSLCFYGLAIGCGLASCFTRGSVLSTWFGALTLLAAVLIPLRSFNIL